MAEKVRMKKILKDRHIWLIVALFLVFAIYNYFQSVLEVSWLPSEATTPFSDTVIDLCFFFSVITLSAIRFKLRGGIVAALAAFPVLVYCRRDGIATADVWTELLFSLFSGIVIAILINNYQAAKNTLQIAHNELQAEYVKTQAVNEKLQKALSDVKTLRGLIPICAACKKVRNEKGYWESVEHYISEHSDADFTHGICKECAAKLYPDLDLNSSV